MPPTGSRICDLPITSSYVLPLSDTRLGKNRRKSEYPKRRVEHLTFRLLIRKLQFHRIKGDSRKTAENRVPQTGSPTHYFSNTSSDTQARLHSKNKMGSSRSKYNSVNLCPSLSILRFLKVVVVSSWASAFQFARHFCTKSTPLTFVGKEEKSRILRNYITWFKE